MMSILQLALLAAAPSIAAGGTVFATAAKRKGEHDQNLIICHLLVNALCPLLINFLSSESEGCPSPLEKREEQALEDVP